MCFIHNVQTAGMFFHILARSDIPVKTGTILRQSRFCFLYLRFYFIIYNSYNAFSPVKLRLSASLHTNPDLEKNPYL